MSEWRHFLLVTRSSYRSQLATIILKECNSNLDKKANTMFCIKTTKVLLLWITTYISNMSYVLELNDFFAYRKHTMRKREKNERLIFTQIKELLRMNKIYYQMNYQMQVHMTALRYWLFIRTCFHRRETILVYTDLRCQSLWPIENESCPSHIKSCRTRTDDRRLFHAMLLLCTNIMHNISGNFL